jgi:hypothetical protein
MRRSLCLLAFSCTHLGWERGGTFQRSSHLNSKNYSNTAASIFWWW